MKYGKESLSLPWRLGTKSGNYKVDSKEASIEKLKKLGKDRFSAISIGHDKGQVALIPMDESNLEIALFIIDVCNNYHQDLEKLQAALLCLNKYRIAQSKMLNKWADSDEKVKQELWKNLHSLEDEALNILTDYKEESCIAPIK